MIERRIEAGGREAAILEALIPSAGRWIEGDVVLARISAPDNLCAHRIAIRLVRWGVLRMERTGRVEARLMLPREFVGVARRLIDDAQAPQSGPRVVLVPEAPRWMGGAAA